MSKRGCISEAYLLALGFRRTYPGLIKNGTCEGVQPLTPWDNPFKITVIEENKNVDIERKNN